MTSADDYMANSVLCTATLFLNLDACCDAAPGIDAGLMTFRAHCSLLCLLFFPGDGGIDTGRHARRVPARIAVGPGRMNGSEVQVNVPRFMLTVSVCGSCNHRRVKACRFEHSS